MKVYGLKHCQLCGKEYRPTGPNQKCCAECGPAAKTETQKGCAARWNEAYPGKNRERAAKWNEAYPEKHRARSIEWNKTHPEKHGAYGAKWEKTHPEKIAVKHSKRRALKYANTPIDEMLTSTEWLAKLAEANGHCHYCDKEAKLTLDHIIPLSKGGKHSASNVVPACAHCNCSKGNKTVEEWNTSQRAQLEAAQ